MEITNGRKSSLRKAWKRKTITRKRKERKNAKNFANVTAKESCKRCRRGKEKTWAITFTKVPKTDGSKSKGGRGSKKRIRHSKSKGKTPIRRNE